MGQTNPEIQGRNHASRIIPYLSKSKLRHFGTNPNTPAKSGPYVFWSNLVESGRNQSKLVEKACAAFSKAMAGKPSAALGASAFAKLRRNESVWQFGAAGRRGCRREPGARKKLYAFISLY